MTKEFLFLLAALPGALFSQSLEGSWQGALKPANSSNEIRVVFKITRDTAGYRGVFYNLAAGRQLNLGAITTQSGALKIAIPGMGGSYDGKFDSDGNSITGTLAQGPNPLPLRLERASAATAWDLPAPPAPPKPLPEGTKLEFDVAAIKPSGMNPGNPGFNVTATEMRTPSISVAGIIAFTWQLHPAQVIGLPGWAETEGYSIVALLPQGGDPTDDQLRAMLKNLLQTRFGLSSHTEKRELSVYTITLGSNGPASIKMVTSTGSGLNIGSQGLGRVRFRGATTANLAAQLQLRVFDRPVIDETGLTARYDFSLDWAPDEFQFPRAPEAQRAAAAANAENLPGIFDAFQQQLGLKLAAAKAPVDVLVIDKVSRPTEN